MRFCLKEKLGEGKKLWVRWKMFRFVVYIHEGSGHVWRSVACSDWSPVSVRLDSRSWRCRWWDQAISQNWRVSGHSVGVKIAAVIRCLLILPSYFPFVNGTSWRFFMCLLNLGESWKFMPLMNRIQSVHVFNLIIKRLLKVEANWISVTSLSVSTARF